MDHYTLSAEAEDRDGDRGIFSVKVSERDSECTPREEWQLTLLMAAERKHLKLVGPMKVEAC